MKSLGMGIPFAKMLFGSTIGVMVNALPVSGIGNCGTKKPFSDRSIEIRWEKGFNPKDYQRLRPFTKPFGSHFASRPSKGSA
jgi:hypothetical protein